MMSTRSRNRGFNKNNARTVSLGNSSSYSDSRRSSYGPVPEITGVCGQCGDNPFVTTKKTVVAFGGGADKFTALVSRKFSGKNVPKTDSIQLTTAEIKGLGGCPTCRSEITENRDAYTKLFSGERAWLRPHLTYNKTTQRMERTRVNNRDMDGTKGTVHFVPVDEFGTDTASFYGRVWEIRGSRTKQYIRIKIALFDRDDGVSVEHDFDSDPDENVQVYTEGRRTFVEFEGEPRHWFGCLIRFRTGTFCRKLCTKDQRCKFHKLWTSWAQGNANEEDDEDDEDESDGACDQPAN